MLQIKFKSLFYEFRITQQSHIFRSHEFLQICPLFDPFITVPKQHTLFLRQLRF